MFDFKILFNGNIDDGNHKSNYIGIIYNSVLCINFKLFFQLVFYDEFL
jgi:hypothetical protein